jgi:hypothetical protein
MRQRKLLGGQIKLKCVAERDFIRVILPAGPAFEQELPLLADNQQLGRFARTAGKFGDRIDDSDVEMRQDDGEFLGRECFASATGFGGSGPCTGDGTGAEGFNGMGGRFKRFGCPGAKCSMTREPNPNQIPSTKTQSPKKITGAIVFFGIWALVIGI